MKYFILSILLLFSIATQAQTTLPPSPFRGYWKEVGPQGRHYAFLERLAVCGDDTPAYTSVKLKGNRAVLTFQQQGKPVVLKLTFKARPDSLIRLSSAQTGTITLKRCDKETLPSQPVNRPFADNGYRTDTALVRILFDYPAPYPNVRLSYPNPFNDRNDKMDLIPDSQGRVQARLPLLNSSLAFLRFSNQYLTLLLEPTDTLLVIYQPQTGTVRYRGRNAALQQEVDALRSWIWPKSKTPQEEENTQDKQLKLLQTKYNRQMLLLDEYIAAHPHTSLRAQLYTKGQIATNTLYSLLQYRFNLDSDQQERFSPAYTAYIHRLWNEIPIPYTLSVLPPVNLVEQFCSYVAQPLPVWFHTPTLELLKEQSSLGKISLTPKQLKDFDDYQYAISLALSLHYARCDSATIDSLATPYREALLRTDSLLNTPAVQELAEQHKDRFPALTLRGTMDKHRAAIDTLPLSNQLKEHYLSVMVCNLLEHEEKSLPDEIITHYESMVATPALRQVVHARQQHYKTLEQTEMAYASSLKSSDTFAAYTQADSLFAELIAPYRGKVIYLDFWGTWCGPCKEQMKLAAPIKEMMKDRDVVFMYLANNSPQDSWQNVIKNYGLTGPNVVHYNLPSTQQKLLERKFNINKFPTYILIDKNGTVSSPNAPSPRNRQTLLDSLEGLLKK